MHSGMVRSLSTSSLDRIKVMEPPIAMENGAVLPTTVFEMSGRPGGRKQVR